MRIFYPSFEFERRTKAFNRYIAFPVSFICVFSVTLLVFAAFYVFAVFLLGIVSSFIWDNLAWFLILPMLILSVTAYQGVTWGKALFTSYKFEKNRIIRGIINDAGRVTSKELVSEGVATTIMLSDMTDSSTVMTGSLVRNSSDMIKRIKANTNKKYVETYFDTEAYAKKIYENPRFVKETKYTLVYQCDNKKKLVIPKIYEGMCPAPERKGLSYIARILLISLLITVFAFFLCVVDLTVGYINNSTYVEQIEDARDSLCENYSSYGYTMETVSKMTTDYKKDMGDRTSTIRYQFDRNGNVKSVEAAVYFDKSSYNVEEEAAFIIGTYNTDFNSEEVDEFIEQVTRAIDGDFEYCKLISEDYTIFMSKRDQYISIYNYLGYDK